MTRTVHKGTLQYELLLFLATKASRRETQITDTSHHRVIKNMARALSLHGWGK